MASTYRTFLRDVYAALTTGFPETLDDQDTERLLGNLRRLVDEFSTDAYLVPGISEVVHQIQEEALELSIGPTIEGLPDADIVSEIFQDLRTVAYCPAALPDFTPLSETSEIKLEDVRTSYTYFPRRFVYRRNDPRSKFMFDAKVRRGERIKIIGTIGFPEVPDLDGIDRDLPWPKGYEEMMKWSLALNSSMEYLASPHKISQIRRMASMCKNRVRNRNWKDFDVPTERAFDPRWDPSQTWRW